MHLIKSVKGALLDTYLLHGWYRMGHLIFTTHHLEPKQDGSRYAVYWLRYQVDKVVLSSKNRKLEERCGGFTVAYRSFSLNGEIEALHRKYHNSLDFQTTDNLRDLLKDVDNNVYDSWLVEVRDGCKLIAAGVFDKGEKSIAGIINFFDPAYKKYSPGKFLMLMKYRYCLENNIPLYYPGYYSPDYPVFDYKLFIDPAATEVLIPEIYLWIPYRNFVDILESMEETNLEDHQDGI